MRKPINEQERLARLRALHVLDPSNNASLQAITTLAAHVCGCSAAYIAFMENEKQLIHSAHGITLRELPRETSICAETILSHEPLVIASIAKEPRYASSPLAQAPHAIDFYAGVPLVTKENFAIGTLCVLDTQSHALSHAQIVVLQSFAHHIVGEIELRNKLAAVQRTISSLEDSEQRFRRIADASPVLLWISDEAGNRTLSNKAWCDFTGLSQEESLAECWRETLHPNDRDVYRAKWSECVAQQARFQHEFRLRHTSGTYRWVLEQAIPLFSSSGRLEAYVCSCVDLSLRSSDELQYQHNEARFRAISEAAPLGIVVTDSQGNCIYSNHQFQRLIGKSADESLGSGWLRSVHPDDYGRIESEWRIATETAQPFESSVRYLRVDGSIAWCTLKAAPINSTDTVSGWVSTIEDVTERRLAHEEIIAAKLAAEDAMHSKSQFLANMSHEMRTPLTAIMGFAEALRDEHALSEAQRHCLEIIVNNSKHLLTIINEILDLSKIDAGALTVEHAPCNIMNLVEDVRLMFAPRIAEKALSFSVNYNGPLPNTITTDALRLKQVLINLLGNAIKFTDAGGISVSVRWTPAEQSLHFEIVDTGIGMSPTQIESLFKPFCQGNETITRQYGGTGLGLSISERLVRALGGTINVTSELGRGSTLSFFVRSVHTSNAMLVGTTELISQRTTASSSEHIPLRGKVLFADDALDNRRLVEHLLRRRGLEVVLAEDGKDAIEAVSREKFDLILMDIQMPQIDGLTATRQIREAGVQTPIIALSAGAMTSDVQKALDAGCSMHLSKPFTQESFSEVLQKYLVSTNSPSPAPCDPLYSTLMNGDPDMLPLLFDFIDGLPARIHDIHAAHCAADWESLRSLAHKLKGSAGMYGFPRLSQAAGALESAAKKTESASAGALCSEIDGLVNRITLAKNAHLPDNPQGEEGAARH